MADGSQMANLTACEKQTGWRYPIICTTIPDAGIGSVGRSFAVG